TEPFIRDRRWWPGAAVVGKGFGHATYAERRCDAGGARAGHGAVVVGETLATRSAADASDAVERVVDEAVVVASWILSLCEIARFSGPCRVAASGNDVVGIGGSAGFRIGFGGKASDVVIVIGAGLLTSCASLGVLCDRHHVSGAVGVFRPVAGRTG